MLPKMLCGDMDTESWHLRTQFLRGGRLHLSQTHQLQQLHHKDSLSGEDTGSAALDTMPSMQCVRQSETSSIANPLVTAAALAPQAFLPGESTCSIAPDVLPLTRRPRISDASWPKSETSSAANPPLTPAEPQAIISGEDTGSTAPDMIPWTRRPRKNQASWRINNTSSSANPPVATSAPQGSLFGKNTSTRADDDFTSVMMGRIGDTVRRHKPTGQFHQVTTPLGNIHSVGEPDTASDNSSRRSESPHEQEKEEGNVSDEAPTSPEMSESSFSLTHNLPAFFTLKGASASDDYAKTVLVCIEDSQVPDLSGETGDFEVHENVDGPDVKQVDPPAHDKGNPNSKPTNKTIKKRAKPVNTYGKGKSSQTAKPEILLVHSSGQNTEASLVTPPHTESSKEKKKRLRQERESAMAEVTFEVLPTLLHIQRTSKTGEQESDSH